MERTIFFVNRKTTLAQKRRKKSCSSMLCQSTTQLQFAVLSSPGRRFSHLGVILGSNFLGLEDPLRACKEYIYIYMYIYIMIIYIYRYVYKFSEHRLVFDFFTHYLQPPNGEIFEKPKNPWMELARANSKWVPDCPRGVKKLYNFFIIQLGSTIRTESYMGKSGP